jgi:hypothetical protein
MAEQGLGVSELMRSLRLVLGGIALLSVTAFCDPLPPPTVIFSRPLPSANLNDISQPNRSNYAFTELPQGNPLAFQSFDGDDFTLSNTSNAYIVESLSTWSVASTLGQALGNEFSSVSLYMRPVFIDPVTGARSPAAPFQVVATGAPNQVFNSDGVTVGNSNPNITDTNVKYFGGQNYESVSTPGTFYPLWQTTFNNLNLTIMSGVTYEFAVWGVGYQNQCIGTDYRCMDPNSLYGYWFNEYSNAALSGSTQQGTDGYYLKFSATDPNAPTTFVDAAQNGGQRSVDLNVTISGVGVPEPATCGLLGLGLIALGYFSRKRSR